MTAEAYRAQGESGLGRNQATHAAGWALFYLGVAESDKGFGESHAATTQRITTAVKTLESEFPGVIEEETKLFKESTK
jgi:hypothetical protein